MSDPYTLATDLLARVAAKLAQLDQFALPTQQYVAPGDSTTIAYDGPALMVSLDLLYEGQPGADRSQTPTYPQFLTSARYSVTLVRPAAVQDDDGSGPTVTAIQADAKTIITDLWAIRTALQQVKADSQAPGGWVGPGVTVVIGPVVPVGPQGAAMAAVGQIHCVVT